MKIVSAFLLLILTISVSAQPYDFSKAKAIINDRIANYNIPSISIAVVKGGKIVWEEGFGYADRENQQKATAHTSYYLASISKTMTATAIMKLDWLDNFCLENYLQRHGDKNDVHEGVIELSALSKMNILRPL